MKTTNILLNENFHAKIADFGLSKIFPADGGTYVSTFSVAGTLGTSIPSEYFFNLRLFLSFKIHFVKYIISISDPKHVTNSKNKIDTNLISVKDKWE